MAHETHLSEISEVSIAAVRRYEITIGVSERSLEQFAAVAKDYVANLEI